jgi:hypothetical protein
MKEGSDESPLRAGPDTTTSGLKSRSNGIQNEQAHFQCPFNLAIPLSFDQQITKRPKGFISHRGKGGHREEPCHIQNTRKLSLSTLWARVNGVSPAERSGTSRRETLFYINNLDGFVKSPSAGLRFIFSHCDALVT